MKVATIFAIIALVIQTVWSFIAQMIYRFGADSMDINHEIMSMIWMVVNIFSGLAMIAFFVTFLSRYDSLKRAAQRKNQ